MVVFVHILTVNEIEFFGFATELLNIKKLLIRTITKSKTFGKSPSVKPGLSIQPWPFL